MRVVLTELLSYFLSEKTGCPIIIESDRVCDGVSVVSGLSCDKYYAVKNMKSGTVKHGAFKYESHLIDDTLYHMIECVYKVSDFVHDEHSSAAEYIDDVYGSHVSVYPIGYTDTVESAVFAKVKRPFVCAPREYVGTYTQIGEYHSVYIHNIDGVRFFEHN